MRVEPFSTVRLEEWERRTGLEVVARQRRGGEWTAEIGGEGVVRVSVESAACGWARVEARDYAGETAGAAVELLLTAIRGRRLRVTRRGVAAFGRLPVAAPTVEVLAPEGLAAGEVGSAGEAGEGRESVRRLTGLGVLCTPAFGGLAVLAEVVEKVDVETSEEARFWGYVSGAGLEVLREALVEGRTVSARWRDFGGRAPWADGAYMVVALDGPADKGLWRVGLARAAYECPSEWGALCDKWIAKCADKIRRDR